MRWCGPEMSENMPCYNKNMGIVTQISMWTPFFLLIKLKGGGHSLCPPPKHDLEDTRVYLVAISFHSACCSTF